jgi:hypothetical protein
MAKQSCRIELYLITHDVVASDLTEGRPRDLSPVFGQPTVSQPNSLAYAFVDHDFRITGELTYGQLGDRARRLATGIAQLAAPPRERALLVVWGIVAREFVTLYTSFNRHEVPSLKPLRSVTQTLRQAAKTLRG